MVRVILSVLLLLLSQLPGGHLCSASTILGDVQPDDKEQKELEKEIRQCSHKGLGNENEIMHCILAAQKKAEVKKVLTDALNLKPWVKRNVTIPPAQLRELFLKEGFTEDGELLESEISIPNNLIVPVIQNPEHLSENRFRSFINTKHLEAHSIKEAVLNLFIKGIRSNEGSIEYHLNVYRFTDVDETDLEPLISYKRTKDYSPRGVWDHLEITDLLIDWVKNPESNYGIMIKAEPEQRGYPTEFDPVVRFSNETAMFVEVHNLPTHPRSRSRRDSEKAELMDTVCAPESFTSDKSCCRYPVMINFADYGWDWVMAPKTYNAYYCVGMCKRGLNPANRHAMMTEYVKQHTLCCAPAVYKPVKIVYVDGDSTITTSEVADMVADKCECR